MKELLVQNNYGVQVFIRSHNNPSSSSPSLMQDATETNVILTDTMYTAVSPHPFMRLILIPVEWLRKVFKQIVESYAEHSTHYGVFPFYIYGDFYSFWQHQDWYLREQELAAREQEQKQSQR